MGDGSGGYCSLVVMCRVLLQISLLSKQSFSVVLAHVLPLPPKEYAWKVRRLRRNGTITGSNIEHVATSRCGGGGMKTCCGQFLNEEQIRIRLRILPASDISVRFHLLQTRCANGDLAVLQTPHVVGVPKSNHSKGMPSRSWSICGLALGCTGNVWWD
jgi:hypothetical protein